MKTKSAVTKRFALLYAVLLTLSLGLVGLSFGRPAAQAIESGGSGAYYLTEDRTTRGLWYNGENGSLDNPDADRNYGRDGTVLFYHWLRENGQPVKDVRTRSISRRSTATARGRTASSSTRTSITPTSYRPTLPLRCRARATCCSPGRGRRIRIPPSTAERWARRSGT